MDNSLYGAIALNRSQALNVAPPYALADIMRPLDTADDRSISLTNLDLDSGLLVHVSFTEPVSVRSMILGSGTGDDSCSDVRVWANRNGSVDWEDIDNIQPDASWVPRREHGTIEYALIPAPRFGNVSSLSIYFVPTALQATVRIYYLGFKGQRRTQKLASHQNIFVPAELGGETKIREKNNMAVEQPSAY